MDYIPVNTPVFGAKEKQYLLECVESGFISSEGAFVHRFENEFASLVGKSHGIAVSSGTAALDVAIAALGIGNGDEVILPSFTIISCASAIVKAGAVPVVVDSAPDTWNMDVSQVEQSITKKTKAIMVVHIYGLPVDMDPIMELAKRYKLKIIEDAAEAIGQAYKGKQCGSFGDVSVFSFYANKHITTGEGGMVLTDNEELGERCRYYRNLCFTPTRRFVHEEIGWNYRMTNMQAAIGVAQMERLNEILERKTAIGKCYLSLLKSVDGLRLPLVDVGYAENLFWVFGIVLDLGQGLDASKAIVEMEKRGIGCRPFFWPIHEQPVFQRKGLFENVHCPIAEHLARYGFYLPSGLSLTEDQVQYVADALREVVSGLH